MVKIRLRRATAAALQRYPGKKKMEKIKTMNFYIHGLCFLSQSSPLCDRIIQLNFTADYTDGQEKAI